MAVVYPGKKSRRTLLIIVAIAVALVVPVFLGAQFLRLPGQPTGTASTIASSNATTPSSSGTTTTVSSSSASVTAGNTITFTANVIDASSPSGAVSWSDGGKGGSFSASGTCTLSSIGSSQS